MTHYPYSGMIPNLNIGNHHPVTEGHQTVIDLCAKLYGVNPSEVYRRSRLRQIVEARMIASYIMRYDLMMGLVEIGQVFRQDHTTVINSCRTIQNLMDTEQVMRERVEKVRQQL